MGRSFYRPSDANTVESRSDVFHHKPSESYFTMLRRDGKYFQRRHQIDPDGREINVMEKQIDFVLGSGNHARTYLHRTPRNTLVELPLGWYAGKGGYWAMNPGYDRPDHEGFRRKITYDCMFCHNGYPKIPAGHDRPFAESVYADPLPEGIDCQRCHGLEANMRGWLRQPGSSSMKYARMHRQPGAAEARNGGRRCASMPSETTSFPLPNSLQRYGRGPSPIVPASR
jgi:hypothetical protein